MRSMVQTESTPACSDSTTVLDHGLWLDVLGSGGNAYADVWHDLKLQNRIAQSLAHHANRGKAAGTAGVSPIPRPLRPVGRSNGIPEYSAASADAGVGETPAVPGLVASQPACARLRSSRSRPGESHAGRGRCVRSMSVRLSQEQVEADGSATVDDTLRAGAGMGAQNTPVNRSPWNKSTHT